MREFFRPYTKAVQINDQDATNIVLHDTSGNQIECNYVTVEAASGSGDSFFLAVPSGINVAMPAADSVVASGLTALTASGVNGLTSSNSGGSVVFGLGDFDKIKGLILSQADSNTVDYVINYGNVNVANPRADNRNTIGN